MICPSCGAEQPESFECVKCGIIFAKYEEHQARVRDGSVTLKVNRWDQSIGPTVRIGRIAAGLAALCVAVIMFLNGAVAKAFGPFVAFVFFAGAGIYFLISLKERIRVRRFCIEAVGLVVASVVLYLSLPDVFSLGTPIYESTVAARPPSEAKVLLNASEMRLNAIRTFMNTKTIKDTEEAVKLSKDLEVDPLDALFASVPAVDQDLMHPVYARLAALRPLLGTLQNRFPNELPDGPAVWLPGAVADSVHAQLDLVEADIETLEQLFTAREETIRQGALSDQENQGP